MGKKMMTPKSERHGYVYVIKSSGLCKIGMTSDIDRRMSEYCNMLPEQPEHVRMLWSTHPRLTEKLFHATFSNKRVHGEWFDLNDDDIVLVDALVDHLSRINR